MYSITKNISKRLRKYKYSLKIICNLKFSNISMKKDENFINLIIKFKVIKEHSSNHLILIELLVVVLPIASWEGR